MEESLTFESTYVFAVEGYNAPLCHESCKNNLIVLDTNLYLVVCSAPRREQIYIAPSGVQKERIQVSVKCCLMMTHLRLSVLIEQQLKD